MLMFNGSPISLKASLLNSPPFSDRNKFGFPKRAIQCLNILSFWVNNYCNTKSSLWSTKCKIKTFLNCLKSIATVSLKLCANENPPTGFDFGFLYFKHILQFSPKLLTTSSNTLSDIPALLIKMISREPFGWSNCLCNLIAICTFSACDLFCRLCMVRKTSINLESCKDAQR